MALTYVHERPIRADFVPDFHVRVSSPWADSLQFAYLQNGDGLVDVSDNALALAKTGSAGIGVGLKGRYADFNGSTYYTASIGVTPPITMMFVANGVATGNVCLGGSGVLATNAARCQFDLNNGVPRSIFINTSGSAYAATSTASALTNNEPFVVVYSVGADLVPRVYFRNKLDTASAGSGTVGTYTGTRVGAIAKSSSLSPYTKPIYLSVCWSRLLTDAECYKLLQNPFGIFEPNRNAILVPVSTGGTTSVNSGLTDAYGIRAAVSSDLADAYGIRASVASSLSDLYGILSSVAASLADSYSINTPVSADLADAYNLRQAIAADLADAYALRALAQSDLADAYGIRASVGSDLSDLYDILSAGSVSSSLSDAYNIRASVGSELSDLANIRAAVASSLADTANIREVVAQQLQDAYTIITSVSADLQDIYNLRQEVVSNLVDAYLIASQSGTCPSAVDIAAAVLAAAQSAPIHANVKQMNDANVIGAGTSADKWRGA